jgi:hypothetical protein
MAAAGAGAGVNLGIPPAGPPHSKEFMDAYLQELLERDRRNMGLPGLDENIKTDERVFLEDYIKKIDEIVKLPVGEIQSMKNSVKAIVDDETLKKMSPKGYAIFEDQIKKDLQDAEDWNIRYRLVTTLEGLKGDLKTQFYTVSGGRRRKTKKSLRKKTNVRKTSHASKRRRNGRR